MLPVSSPAATPAAVILACDARIERPLYADDQIWELRIREGGPGVLAAQTTFGLRARTMRIFPRFLSGSAVVDDPAQFSSPPRAVWLGTSYCALEYAPFPGIDVLGEYWVPDSRVLAGRIQLTNRREAPSTCRLELAAQLVPLEGQAMSAAHARVSATLRGQSGSLYPVLFLTGGPDTGSGLYPSLILDFKLPPGDSRQVGWALASMDDANRSYELARQTTARPWPAEIARLKMQDASDQVLIETGDQGWDAVLAHSQRAARRLLHGPGTGLPETSFVLARTPDQGYSRRGDGSEYNYLWSGQTALEACLLASSLLPGGADLAAGFLRNFLAVQAADGSIDWKPGLAGQRGRLLAQPVLAELAWRIFLATGDLAFLAGVYPPLMRFLSAWQSPDHDRDGDGVPEWDHLVQNGFEDSPLFNRWLPGAQGLDIQLVETPGLASLLYNECRSLARMADRLGKPEDLPRLEENAARLAAAVQSTWDEERGTFHHRDRDTHLTQVGETLFRGQGPGEAQLDLQFDAPRRLVIRMRIGTETTRPVHIRVLGADAGGQAVEEAFTIRDVQWIQHQACLTAHQPYCALNRVILDGFDPLDEITIETADTAREDITLFFPLWAGIATPAQSEKMVQKALLDPERYATPYGLASRPQRVGEDSASEAQRVPAFWNAWMIEGLARAGFQREAADLLARWMDAASSAYQNDGGIYPSYDAASGRPGGEKDHLGSLIPAGLFLEVLGVQLISPQKVLLRGGNPFPRPVTVQYRRMRVARQANETRVTFPDGQSAVVKSPEPQTVEEVEVNPLTRHDKEEG